MRNPKKSSTLGSWKNSIEDTKNNSFANTNFIKKTIQNDVKNVI